jgi:hypothetical protein
MHPFVAALIACGYLAAVFVVFGLRRQKTSGGAQH